jgi:repressor LexA
MAKGLTKRQEEILDFIVGGVRDEGFPPTLKEIAARFGLASPNAARITCWRSSAGFLKRTGVKSRALSLSPVVAGSRHHRRRRSAGWPLLGVVPAGTPVLAEENFEGYVDLNELFGRGRAGTFLLKVSGESMIGAGINDGDLVVVAPPGADRLGEIGVAYVAGEATVKRLFHEEGSWPAAGELGARPDQGLGRGPGVQGRGKVIGVVRRFSFSNHTADTGENTMNTEHRQILHDRTNTRPHPHPHPARPAQLPGAPHAAAGRRPRPARVWPRSPSASTRPAPGNGDKIKSEGTHARWIAHLDMDCFFVSVERLLDRPRRQAGRRRRRRTGRGVVASASYEARRFGVRSAMASRRAKEALPG